MGSSLALKRGNTRLRDLSLSATDACGLNRSNRGVYDLSGLERLLNSIDRHGGLYALDISSNHLQDEGAVLVGVHVRRGDASMQTECTDCVNADDPDVKSGMQRLPLAALHAQMGCVNASLAAIRRASGKPAYAFVASDTAEGLRVAVETLGAAHVLHVAGDAVHSTRPRAWEWRHAPATLHTSSKLCCAVWTWKNPAELVQVPGRLADAAAKSVLFPANALCCRHAHPVCWTRLRLRRGRALGRRASFFSGLCGCVAAGSSIRINYNSL